MRTFALAPALSLLALSAHALAADFYIDPASGSPANDGSAESPWASLQQVLDGGLIESQGWESLPFEETSQLVVRNPGAPVKAGDTLWLRTGYHGAVEITGYYNEQPITIAVESGHEAQFSRVAVTAGSNWILRGLVVSPEFAPEYDPQTMIALESHNWQGPIRDITVEDCSMWSRQDVSSWSADNWDQLSANGLSVQGQRMVVRNNLLRNVNFGISVTASDSTIEGNTIDSFAGDGLRGLGNYTVFENNTVKNCYAVNANHDDGFQSWSTGTDGSVGTGEVVGIVLRGNRIINYEDPDQPFRGTLQGIGCFDGMFVDWVVENNIIITDHWHGITLMGARNSRIVNNTVVDLNAEDPGPPWISIADHKNGTPPEGCLVRNNLTTALNLAESGVLEDHNIIVDDLSLFFLAPPYDVHLIPSAPAIDTGSSESAPSTDVDGVPRPQGAAVDVGAYEWHEGGIGGSSTGGAGGTSSGGTTGDGGTSSGGTTGDGGTSSGGTSSGGATGDGGTSSGGTSSGGATGDGGTSSGGTSSGGATGDGGTSGGGGEEQSSGGTGGAGGGASGSGGKQGADAGATPPTGDEEEDSGCGCRIESSRTASWYGLVPVGLWLLRRRRVSGR